MTSSITSVCVRDDYRYEVLHEDNALVPTRITVQCETPPGTKKVELSPLALPFGNAYGWLFPPSTAKQATPPAQLSALKS